MQAEGDLRSKRGQKSDGGREEDAGGGGLMESRVREERIEGATQRGGDYMLN